MRLSLTDLSVIFLYFAGMIAVGLYFARRNKSTDQYFLAGKSFPGWVIGISFVGSVISSVTFIAIPADAFKTAWLRFIPNLAFPIVCLLAAFIFIPFYRRGTITSAYGYLAARFGNSISAYAASIFLVSQLTKTSTIAYLLSILLENITGWNFSLCLLVVVGVTIIYTVKGGVTAVIWTDVIQTFILLAGALVCIGFIIYSLPNGLTTLFSDAATHHKFAVNYDITTSTGTELVRVPWNLSLSEKTVTMMLVLGFFQFLGVITDQSTVQRWCAASSAREARRSMFVLGFGCIPVWALFQFLGTCLFVYYLYNPDPFAQAILGAQHKAEHILPYFITHSLGTGLIGIVIAGALAAAMSTLSASINTSSMVVVNDLVKKFSTTARPDSAYLLLGKSSALAVSLLTIAGALAIRILDAPTLTDLSQQIAAIITSGVPGIFLAGIFTRRVNLAGAWAGLAASMLFVLYIKAGNIGLLPEALTLNFLPHYLAIAGNSIAFVAALLVATFVKNKPRPLENLTLWTQSSAPLE